MPRSDGSAGADGVGWGLKSECAYLAFKKAHERITHGQSSGRGQKSGGYEKQYLLSTFDKPPPATKASASPLCMNCVGISDAKTEAIPLGLSRQDRLRDTVWPAEEIRSWKGEVHFIGRRACIPGVLPLVGWSCRFAFCTLRSEMLVDPEQHESVTGHSLHAILKHARDRGPNFLEQEAPLQ